MLGAWCTRGPEARTHPTRTQTRGTSCYVSEWYAHSRQAGLRCTCTCSAGSSAEVDSSHTQTAAPDSSTRMMPTRWASPPLRMRRHGATQLNDSASVWSLWLPDTRRRCSSPSTCSSSNIVPSNARNSSLYVVARPPATSGDDESQPLHFGGPGYHSSCRSVQSGMYGLWGSATTPDGPLTTGRTVPLAGCHTPSITRSSVLFPLWVIRRKVL